MKLSIVFLMLLLSLSCSPPVSKYLTDESLLYPEDTVISTHDYYIITDERVKEEAVYHLRRIIKIVGGTEYTGINICYEMETERNEFYQFCEEVIDKDFEVRLTDPNLSSSDRKAARLAVDFLKIMDSTIGTCYSSFD